MPCCAVLCAVFHLPAGSATVSNLFSVPGLQATLTSTPPLLGQQPAAHSLTLDYVTAAARLRCEGGGGMRRAHSWE